VKAEEAAGDVRRTGDLGDAQRRGRGGEIGVRAGLGDGAQHLALRLDLLDHRLDDDVAIGKVLGIRRNAQPRWLGPLDLGAGGNDFLLRPPGRGLAASKQNRVAGGGSYSS
jgi:hypothetical protein